MHTAKKQRKSKALLIALLFGVVVLLLIGLSLLVKLGVLFAQSKFDSMHQFILQVKENNTTSDVIIFDPDTHKINILTMIGNGANASASKTVQLPIDAIVTRDASEETSGLIHRVLVGKNILSNLNIFDRLRLLAFSQTVADEDITTKKITLPVTSTTIDNTITSLATDETLYKEGMTIAIVNGSGVSGLGTALAKLLTHIGGNVISVTTADTDVSVTSLLYTGKKSYTAKRLEEIFAVTGTSTDKSNIADMTLTIGKNKAEFFTPL